MAKVCVVGGGPAGMMLGLLLARCGVEVTVLEKHADFLRDFRGDTVHASTLTLLDELGLGPAFARLPARYVTSVDVGLDSGVYPLIDLTRLPGTHQHIALVPQWDLLDLLADAARVEPTFTLLTEGEVTALRRTGDRVSGVAYRHGETTYELDADLVVACDGRTSRVRDEAGLPYREFGVPMDVLWFRLPRHEGDVQGGFGRFTGRSLIVLIDRGDYFQIGFLIRKGSYSTLRAEGIEAFRERLTAALPWLAERVGELISFDDLRLLDVRLGRLRRWWADGLLCLGDAAHAMSPVGGVGINLAVQDAVAAARMLAPVLLTRAPTTGELRAVQRRRGLPTVLTQGVQRLAHRFLLARAVGDAVPTRTATRKPPLMAVLDRFPVLRRIPAYVVAIGVRPEQPPGATRRPAGLAPGAVSPAD